MAGVDLRRVEETMAAAKVHVAEAEADLVTSREALAAAEAGAAMGKADVDRQARRAYATARDGAEFAAARVAGLEPRVRQAAEALAKAQHDLAVEFRLWQRQAVETVLTDYREALATFLRAVHVVAGAGTALGANRLARVVRGTALCDPDDPERNPANMRRNHWRDTPAAAEVYERLLAVRQHVDRHLGEFRHPMTLTTCCTTRTWTNVSSYLNPAPRRHGDSPVLASRQPSLPCFPAGSEP